MIKKQFQPVSAQVNFPELEEEVLKYWKDNKIFEKSVESRPAGKTWTFLDGPPFITGLPHYGTLLSSIPKDLFPRFWTMKGYRVRRVWGWDCHGLPAENKVEQKLGLQRKKDIEEKVGVKKFIDECKLYVQNVSDEWEWYVDHIGRWVDFKKAYKTMDLPYMETVMWVFKEMYDKGYIYKGLRVSLYCPHDVTPISNFEVAMDADNYKDVTEPTAVFMYELAKEPGVYLLAWSTTPWNKLATTALAVNSKLTYVKVKQGKKTLILAKSTLKMLTDEPYKIVEEFAGEKLVGQKFVPHYDFFKVSPGKKIFVVIPGDFVTSDEGTGVVTIAAYGEEDLVAMQKENVEIVLHVDEEGMLKKDVPKWGGMYYLDADPLVLADLKERGLLYRVDEYTHSVPTCWRCHTRLYYAPQNAWYVDIGQLKDKMKKTNESVNWYPEHFKYGRYLKSLEAAPDWCISRSRYWGSPVPVWECECGERFVPGSIAELEKASGKKISDLHKPIIDEVTVTCQKCGKTAKRVPEVLDSWIEAGSAAFGERHFPFEKAIKLEDFFPPDFIVEYTGQIRAWFYVLHVIAVALFNSKAFKNVVVTGVILGTDGRKMSKNYGNYPDPKEMITNFGGDALRLYLLGSPVMHGEDIRISGEQYRNQVKGILLLLWNVYNFFVTYANVDGFTPSKSKFVPRNVLDRWIVSKLNHSIKEMTEKGYEVYDAPEIVNQASLFMHDLSLWYVRRIRERVGPSVPESEDKKEAHQTLWFVLREFTKATAPLVPFISEEIYRNLTHEESVHLAGWPEIVSHDPILESAMKDGMKLASCLHAFRKLNKIKVRIPLKKVIYVGPSPVTDEVREVILSETNIYELIFKEKVDEFAVVDTDAGPANQDEKAGRARELVRDIQILRKQKGCKIDERINLTLPDAFKDLPVELIDFVQKETLIRNISWGSSLAISTQ